MLRYRFVANNSTTYLHRKAAVIVSSTSSLVSRRRFNSEKNSSSSSAPPAGASEKQNVNENQNEDNNKQQQTTTTMNANNEQQQRRSSSSSSSASSSGSLLLSLPHGWEVYLACIGIIGGWWYWNEASYRRVDRTCESLETQARERSRQLSDVVKKTDSSWHDDVRTKEALLAKVQQENVRLAILLDDVTNYLKKCDMPSTS